MNLDTHLVHIRLVSITYGIGLYRAVFQFYTIGDSLHILLAHISVEPHMVYLFLDKLRVRQFRCKVAIVRQQQYAGRVAVETSHRINPFGTSVTHDIHHRESSLWIVRCSHTILRFIQQYVNLAFQSHHLATKCHRIITGNLRSQFGHGNPVDQHFSGLNKFVGLTTGTDLRKHDTGKLYIRCIKGYL